MGILLSLYTPILRHLGCLAGWRNIMEQWQNNRIYRPRGKMWAGKSINLKSTSKGNPQLFCLILETGEQIILFTPWINDCWYGLDKNFGRKGEFHCRRQSILVGLSDPDGIETQILFLLRNSTRFVITDFTRTYVTLWHHSLPCRIWINNMLSWFCNLSEVERSATSEWSVWEF